ncbi:thioredoxin domain-containing protein [Kordia sp.]|uniref:thioredoxin domain-containing protein n=1 Tax=Kordia sp. TaxID=1965332 RepID=UPI003D26E5A6
MTNIKMLFLYLKKMKIHLDQKEFTFQLESHPEYPSLLAISDTLHLFQIENAALHVDKSQVESLPNYFITKLKDTQQDSLTYIEAHKTSRFYTVYQNSRKITLSKEAFLKKWKGIVFLVEENTKLSKKLHSFKLFHAIAIACLLTFLVLLKHYFPTTSQFLFVLFPLLGLFFSIVALQHIFNLNQTFVDTFCSSTNSQQCTSVVNSTRWKILEKISFSDISITFFSFQILLFFSSGFTNSLDLFFELQKIILFASIPILILSLYYQKFIAKKWCRVCISITGIIISELIYVLVFHQHSTVEILFSHYNLYIFVFLAILLSWYFIKDKLITINNLKSLELKATRFKKNYTLFRNTLFSSPITVLPQTALIFGNESAKVTLDFVTNPYCGFCKAPYFMLKEMLQRHKKEICIRFFFNFDLNKNSTEASKLVQHLIYIYEKFGTELFFNALEDWYQESDLKNWLQQYSYTYDTTNIDELIQNHRSHFVKHRLTFTPFLAVNGHQFPEMYSITDFTYFIEELVDENTIQLAESRKAINRVDTII